MILFWMLNVHSNFTFTPRFDTFVAYKSFLRNDRNPQISHYNYHLRSTPMMKNAFLTVKLS